MTERTYPELFTALSKVLREEGAPDDIAGHIEMATVFEIAADRWDTRSFVGDRLLAAIGDLARKFETVALLDDDNESTLESAR